MEAPWRSVVGSSRRRTTSISFECAAREKAQKSYIDLTDVYAIQLIKEYVRDNSGSKPGTVSYAGPYYSYELNLVLKDGERMNVVDHGDLQRIRADAIRLGGFLGSLPVWDAT